MDYSSLSEHAILAALDTLDEDHPVVCEVARLVDKFTLQAEAMQDDGEDVYRLYRSAEYMAPIEKVALELVLENLAPLD